LITVRPAAERGHFDFGWLNTYHSFSFGEYYDRRHMGFRSLRVINEDWVQPGRGFGTHGHKDMEILTYVLEGELQHRDSMGNGSIIRPGEVQRMTAGSGVRHSEYNHSEEELVHLLQIWILPGQVNLQPGYEQQTIDIGNQIQLIASPAGVNGSVLIHQDARVYAAKLADSDEVRHELAPKRHAWLQVARGAVTLKDHKLTQGDGAAVSEEQQITIQAQGPAEILLFDLA
jgi:quercetin 2,3-dioxygenase